MRKLLLIATLVPNLVLAQENNMGGTSNTNPYSGQTNYYDSTGRVCQSNRNPYTGQVDSFCR